MDDLIERSISLDLITVKREKSVQLRDEEEFKFTVFSITCKYVLLRTKEICTAEYIGSHVLPGIVNGAYSRHDAKTVVRLDGTQEYDMGYALNFKNILEIAYSIPAVESSRSHRLATAAANER